MTDRQQGEWPFAASVAERFMVGFEGTSLPEELGSLLAAGLAGVAIFQRNFTSPERLWALTEQIRQAAGRPVLIGIDQEGGTRFALPPPFTIWPSPTELGRLNDTQLVEQTARAMARELRAAGCNLNFAPMLELAMNAQSPVTRDRSFGSHPHKVAAMGAAFTRGLRDAGVLACAKHYPGHGDTQVDPHEDLPVFHGTLDELDIQLVPFAAAISAGAPVIMTAHILLPQIDPERPASLSHRMLTEVLRQRLGFKGVILADDLGMGAIARRHGPGDAAMAAFQAGTDVALLCHDWSAVYSALHAVARARDAGRFSETPWEAAHNRIEGLLAATQEAPVHAPGLEVIGCAEHRALAAEIRARVAKVRAT